MKIKGLQHMHTQTMAHTLHAHSNSASHKLCNVIYVAEMVMFDHGIPPFRTSMGRFLLVMSAMSVLFLLGPHSCYVQFVTSLEFFSLPYPPTLEATCHIILPSWVTEEVVRESEVCAESSSVTECTRRARRPVRHCKTSTGSGTCIAHRVEGWRRWSCNWIHCSKCQALESRDFGSANAGPKGSRGIPRRHANLS